MQQQPCMIWEDEPSSIAVEPICLWHLPKSFHSFRLDSFNGTPWIGAAELWTQDPSGPYVVKDVTWVCKSTSATNWTWTNHQVGNETYPGVASAGFRPVERADWLAPPSVYIFFHYWRTCMYLQQGSPSSRPITSSTAGESSHGSFINGHPGSETAIGRKRNDQLGRLIGFPMGYNMINT